MLRFRIKNILVPFDFTNESLNSLKVADKFARDFNAKIHLLNIINPKTFNCNWVSKINIKPFNDVDIYAEKSYKVIERYLQRTFINPELYQYSVEFGEDFSTMVNHIKSSNYDLIILLDTINNYLSHIFSMFNPLSVMDVTHVPVIAVNKYYRVVEFRNIIVPIRNMDNWYDKLPFMISLARQSGGKIHAVGIDESQKTLNTLFYQVFEQAIAILEHENVLSTVAKFRGQNCVNYLKSFSENQKGDLIAVTPPLISKSIKSILYPPLYSRLILDSPAPVFGVKL